MILAQGSLALPMQPEAPVVSLRGVSVCRGSHLAVQDVSFEVLAGSNTAVVGPNGAGKSTLIQAILGILPRQCGQIQVLGSEVSLSGQISRVVRQQVAYVPQSFQFDRGIPMTVGEFVALGWGAAPLPWYWGHQQERDQAVRQALERVQAGTLLEHSLSHLSGGEMKRVLLAYCLVWPRRLLILDEAPAGLDLRGEEEFYQLLEELRQSCGWTILQISHDLDMVSRHCDRVLCLNGRLLCQGSPGVALTTEVMQSAYGSGFVRYAHHHSSTLG
ncbi:MAG: metal ABC transporter ATP-binding protein [Synechococcales cyanobacterium]